MKMKHAQNPSICEVEIPAGIDAAQDRCLGGTRSWAFLTGVGGWARRLSNGRLGKRRMYGGER